MNISLLTRQQLEIINRKTLKYPLHIAEKDYFLALVMQIVSQSFLRDILVFKGGTAVNHCYLDQYRFSEDLDFSSNRVGLSIVDIRQILTGFDFLVIKKDYVSEATIKIERLQYTGPLALPNFLKIEIDHFQNVLLPPQRLKYNNVWGLDFDVQVMDVKEITAEKIRAMSDRARYRDFYDLFLLLDKYDINVDEIISYVRQKEIRKPITKPNIYQNWGIVSSQKAKEMRRIYYSRTVSDNDISTLIEKLPFSEIV